MEAIKLIIDHGYNLGLTVYPRISKVPGLCRWHHSWKMKSHHHPQHKNEFLCHFSLCELVNRMYRITEQGVCSPMIEQFVPPSFSLVKLIFRIRMNQWFGRFLFPTNHLSSQFLPDLPVISFPVPVAFRSCCTAKCWAAGQFQAESQRLDQVLEMAQEHHGTHVRFESSNYVNDLHSCWMDSGP